MKKILCFTIVLCIALGSLTAQENYFIAGDTAHVLYYDIQPDYWLDFGITETYKIDIDLNGTYDFAIETEWWTGVYYWKLLKVISYGNNMVGYSHMAYWPPSGDVSAGIGLEYGDTINNDVKFTSSQVIIRGCHLDSWGHTHVYWDPGAYIPVYLKNSSYCNYRFGWIKVYDVSWDGITLDSYAVDISQSCLPDGITFETQAQIDSFQINYPCCNEIEGSVWILSENITTLSGLSKLTRVKGDIHLGADVCNLVGLNNLTEIEGSFIFYNSCNSLNSLEGLGKLSHIGGDLMFGTSENLGFASLTSLEHLNNLEEVGGSLLISGEALESLDGLEGLSEVKGLSVSNTASLVNLNGLNNLSSVNGNLSIKNNEALLCLEGLENVDSIAGNVNIGGFGQMANPTEGNSSLKTLSGINNLSSIGGDLAIMGNDSLIDLSGLENLKSIGGSLDIFYNSSLKSISHLSKLYTINGRIKIGYDHSGTAYGNKSLVSLSGLENIEYGTITEIDIAWNDLLSECEVNSICEYLANNTTGPVNIHDNAPGCDSKEEVEEACSFLVKEQIDGIEILIWPNPTSQILKISTEGYTIDEVIIYTLTGQQMFAIRPQSETIDISILQPGMYIVEVMVEGRKVRQKLLIHR